MDSFALDSYKTRVNIDYVANASKQPKGERLALDIYYPTDKEAFSTIIWFHGGGLVTGNKELPQELMKRGVAVVAPSYRLVPDVSYKTSIEDAASAVAWVMKNIESMGGSSERVFVSGHSAGGYLASMVVLDKNYLDSHGVDANRVAGLIPFSGQTITHFIIREQMGLSKTQPLVDEYAPLFHIRKDAPPILLLTGDRELEMLGRYEENAYMWRMMKEIGHKDTHLIEIKGFGHDMMAPGFPLLIDEVERITQSK